MTNKRKNKIYDGRWKITKVEETSEHHYRYTLTNIYNNEEIVVSRYLMTKIDKGLSVCKVYRKKKRKEIL